MDYNSWKHSSLLLHQILFLQLWSLRFHFTYILSRSCWLQHLTTENCNFPWLFPELERNWHLKIIQDEVLITFLYYFYCSLVYEVLEFWNRSWRKYLKFSWGSCDSCLVWTLTACIMVHQANLHFWPVKEALLSGKYSSNRKMNAYTYK